MRKIEQFVLDIPYLFIKKVPYVWVAVVGFWHWPPVLSGIFLVIMLLAFVIMAWQQRAWEAFIRREFSSDGALQYVDRPHASRLFQLRNLMLVLAGAAALGWLLAGRLGLSGTQWAPLLAGVMLLYKNTLLFGAPVAYLITDQGLAIRFLPGQMDYRFFFKFGEIRQAVRTQTPKRMPLRWDVLAPRNHPAEGVLLYPMRPEGFTKRLVGELLLAPGDMDGFLAELSRHVAVTGAKAANTEDETLDTGARV
jgi:hypothetical protein